jgi:hypothetical protein
MICQDALLVRVAPIARSPERSRQRFDERPKRGTGSHDVAETAGSPPGPRISALLIKADRILSGRLPVKGHFHFAPLDSAWTRGDL